MENFEKQFSQPETEEKSEKEVFSDEELKDINRIRGYDDAIYKIKEDFQFLSGRKKKEAEKDITDYKERRDKALDFAVDKIKSVPGSAERLKLIKPEEAGIVAAWKKFEKEGGDLTSAEGNKKKEYQVYEIGQKRWRFMEYLENELNIDAYSTKQIIDKLWLEKAKEAGFPAKEEREATEKKEKTETVNLPYEYFDASEALEKINKFTEAELKNLAPNERLELKKERLKNLKKDLAEQMVGISEINAEIEAMVLDSEVIDRKKLDNYLSEKSELYRLNSSQLEKYRHVFDEIEERNHTINKVAEKFSGKTDEEIFIEMFGQKPVGEVEIKKGAISFFVICKNIEDYSRLYVGSDKPEDIEIARSTGGFAGSGRTIMQELEGAVTVANAAGKSSKSWLESVRIHEEKHILEKMTRKVETAGEYEKFTESEKLEIQKKELGKIINQDKIGNERRAKNEILAFLKDGTPPAFIKNYLLKRKAEGGLYDYFENDKKFYSHPSYAKFGKELLNETHAEFRNKYEGNIVKALETAEKLEKLGFPRDRIIGLFQAERLDQWDKTYMRFKTSEEFRKRKEETLKNLNVKIEEAKRAFNEFGDALKKEQKRFKISKAIDSLELKIRNKFAKTKSQWHSNEEYYQTMFIEWVKTYSELIAKKEEYEKL